MTTPTELADLCDLLYQPPFKKQYTVIQLHDELSDFELVSLIHDVMLAIDEVNPNSIHKRVVDIRNEEQEDTVWRVTEFLKLLKYKPLPGDFDSFRATFVAGNRDVLLHALYFLVKDLSTHKKRAYLAPFLSTIEIPVEFQQDDVVAQLTQQTQELQEQFKTLHKYVEGLRANGSGAHELKKEIQAMEEEKQQIMNNLTRLKKKVMSSHLPNMENWLTAARTLRQEQMLEGTVAEKITDQRHQLFQAEQKLVEMHQKYRTVVSTSTADADTHLSKLVEQVKMNRYLCDEKLVRSISEKQAQLKELNKLVNMDNNGSSSIETNLDTERLENNLREMNEEIMRLATKKAELSASASGLNNGGGSGEDKLALFRQQAAIIARKKEGIADKLNHASLEHNDLNAELDAKREKLKILQAGGKSLKGEEFKQYVTELRGKSNIFKMRKTELSELVAEYGVLSRTEEVLRAKKKKLDDQLGVLERQKGVGGFRAAQETLEKVSEKKGEVDELKGKTLNEISEIVNQLMVTINEKKTLLSPIIQELRNLRLQYAEQESQYESLKKTFDSVLLGLHTEVNGLEAEAKNLRTDFESYQSRFEIESAKAQITELLLERAHQETKAYTTGDHTATDLIPPGYKSYRDLYNKRLAEAELLSKTLKEESNILKMRFEGDLKQAALFEDIKTLLNMKRATLEKRVEKGGNDGKLNDGAVVVQDRLVL